jgi:hypothetical protein
VLIGLCGFLVFLPHAWKNQVLFQEPLAPFVVLNSDGFIDLDQHWYSPDITRYVVATYPVALVFGQYSNMGGTLSPLLLVFLPLAFFLPRPRKWSQSLLTIITLAGLLTLVL